MPLRKTTLLLLLVIAFAVLPAQATAGQKPNFALKDGERVVFYGDSITEQRLYTTYVEHYVLTRYPERRVKFINTGWGGDKVTGNECVPCAGVGGLARIERDVIAYRPTVVTLLFGMNDGRYRTFDPATLKAYEDGLSAIIREIKTKTRARIYVMTPTAYDGAHSPPWSQNDLYNDVLDRYSEAAKQIAAREGLTVIDLHSVTAEALRRAKQKKSDYTFLPDGVHPVEDGQLIMAAEILRAWGAGGTEINERASNGQNGSARLNISAPLPWPSPLPSDTIREVRPEVVDPGKITLKLAGLSSGDYSVSVDGAIAGEYTAEQLGAGIAIGSEKASDASRSVAALIRRRADLFFMRWRQIQVPLEKDYPSTARAISSIDAVIEDMTARARALSKPRSYEVVVTRVR
ncbi:MAG: SGNH/GDSL hydrolase family protein [Blastocatellia bacterium]|nr:SGNH/GDSL hydrolase family protein [Blastocatellia bacterium]